MRSFTATLKRHKFKVRSKLIDTVSEIFDLSARKRRLQSSENPLLTPMCVGVTRKEDKDIKAALFPFRPIFENTVKFSFYRHTDKHS